MLKLLAGIVVGLTIFATSAGAGQRGSIPANRVFFNYHHFNNGVVVSRSPKFAKRQTLGRNKHNATPRSAGGDRQFKYSDNNSPAPKSGHSFDPETGVQFIRRY